MAAIASAFRQFHRPPISGRHRFADTKYEHKHRQSWERYKDVYARVRAAGLIGLEREHVGGPLLVGTGRRY